MADQNTTGKSFLEVVQDARKVPEGLDSGAASDFPQFFKQAQSPVMRQGPEETLGVPTNCVSFSKVFLVWRFWGDCVRCSADFKEGRATLPETGEYTCPHTQEAEYKEAVDRCLRGDAALQSRNYFNLRDGTRCVHMEWLEHDAAYLRELQKKEEIRRKNRVWPPDPESVFAEAPIPRGKKEES